MAERLNTTLAADTSLSFSPSDDPVIQVDAEAPVTVDIEIRMDTSLNWAGAYSFRSDAEPVVRLKKVPFMRYKVRGNIAGKSVKIWDNL